MTDNQNNQNNQYNQNNKNNNILTVSDLNNLIKDILQENLNGKIKVKGEISNLKISRGHMYLTLKDKESMINVVLWNCNKNKSFMLIKDGDKVIVDGIINVYPKGGYYNINSYNISIVGEGDIYKDYTTYKKFYEELGYFNKDTKKELPYNLNNIGVITALEGAALKDFLYVLTNGEFKGNIYIKNGIVQGKDCPKSIVECINLLDSMGLDVIVVTRGGGSLEDLIGFSHPDIIECIHNAKTCIISAIGHEVDNMLSDYVADVRAPTPSVAAEIIVKNQCFTYNKMYYDETLYICHNHIKNEIFKINNKVANLETTILDANVILHNYLLKLDNDILNIHNVIRNKINNQLNMCDTFDNIIDRSNPTKILENGYCIITDDRNNKILNKKDYLKNINKKLKIIFIDGTVDI